ncbi:hypothetical protein [Streptomyces sp. A30]|uniref:hypothetical protein n=1 Tax=Streptomyces sp. A30 TaxID=2789273 RepID=UPI00397F2E3D
MKKVLSPLTGAALAVGLLLGLLAVPQSTAAPPSVAGAQAGVLREVAQDVVRDEDPEPYGGSWRRLDDWLQSRIGEIAYIARKARGIASPSDVGRNLAVGFWDITGLNGLRTQGYEVVDVAALLKSDPQLYRELKLRHRPGIERFLIMRETNDRSLFHKDEVLVDGAHSELRMLIHAAQYVGIQDIGRLFNLYSDFSPCKSKCAPRIPKSTDVQYAAQYRAAGYKDRMKGLLDAAGRATKGDKAIHEEVAREKARMAQLKEANTERRYEKARETNKVLRTDQGGTCGSLGLGPARSGVQMAALASAVRAGCGEGKGVAESGLVRALSEPVPEAPGGIDFSALELRYLSDPGDGSGLQYSFQAPASTTGGTSPDLGVEAARLTSDAFFTWLQLDPSAYWVNLNPSEPDRITDPRLGRTDAGRVLLEADLQLKKDTGRLIHPDSTTGRQFWAGLEGRCILTRVWIVPSPAQVRTDGDRLYILDAPLDVKMESAHRSQLPMGQDPLNCPQKDEATERHNEELFRSLVLDRLKKDVNSAPQYADLRRVYLARVAAEWYRDLSRSETTTYGDLVGRGEVGPWATRTDWQPRDTFDAYVESRTEGEFDIDRSETHNGLVYRATYFYGGVDLAEVPLRQVSDGSFEARYGSLSEDVGASLKRPSPGDASGTLWLGSPTPRQAAGLGPPGDGSSPWDLTLRLLPFAAAVLLLPLAVLLLRRWRRRPLSTPAAVSPLRQAALRSARTRPHPQGDNHVVRGREGPGP